MGWLKRPWKPWQGPTSHEGFLSHMRTPSYHPKLDHFSIETHDFGSPISGNLHIGRLDFFPPLIWMYITQIRKSVNPDITMIPSKAQNCWNSMIFQHWFGEMSGHKLPKHILMWEPEKPHVCHKLGVYYLYIYIYNPLRLLRIWNWNFGFPGHPHNWTWKHLLRIQLTSHRIVLYKQAVSM